MPPDRYESLNLLTEGVYMQFLMPAFTEASQVWELAVVQLNWFHVAISMAYGGAAWLCLLNARIAQDAREAFMVWYGVAAVLCVLGANTVLHGDLWMSHVLRVMARMEGWYGDRRWLQYGVVVILMLIALAAASWLRAELTACDLPAEPVSVGVTVLMVIVLLRIISAHGSDFVMNYRVVGISLGRFFEFCGLGWVVQGAWRCLRLR